MQKFLTSAAQFILKTDKVIHQTTVVMPSRRAAVFFRQALSEQSDTIILAPKILSIEDLCLELSGLETASQAHLFFKLFEAYQDSIATAEPFEEFNKWGRLLLQDFNEIDRHLVDPDSIFNYLGDLKRIENWGLELGEADAMAKDYLALWPKLALVYKAYRAKLLEEGLAYQGLAYREFYQVIAQKRQTLKDHYGHFFFLGFNALNKAEEEGFKILFEEGIADFFWDVDQYYFNNEKHEAGLFLRKSPLFKSLKKAGKLYGLHSKLKEGKRQVKSIAVSGKNLQAYIANQELGSLPVQEQSNAALVLADEDLLSGILNNLHPKIQSFNLSMGLSLKHSPLAGFFELLIDFALEAERSNRKDRAGKQRFSHKRWNALLSHFVLKRLPSPQVKQLEAKRLSLIQENALFRSLDELDLGESLHPLSNDLFSGKLSPAEFFDKLAQFSLDFHQEVDQEKYLNETLYGFYQAFRQLAALLKEYPYIESFEHCLSFYRELLSDLSMDLKGEPLSGLQVMGMLETRLLDFEKLVICSMNEGVLPKGRSENSLLPFDVKRKFGLPTYLEKDAVYAYHFYRLLHNAQEVTLLYSTSDSGMGQLEPSRFIRQLNLEWPHSNPKVSLEELNATGTATSLSLSTEEVEKSPAIMARLQEMAQNGFSPTALIQYLKDPLAFYYERVLGLKPEDEIQEELELPLQGTALHHCLEKYYSIPDPKEPGKRIPRSPDAEDPIFSKSLNEYKADLRIELENLLPGAEIDHGPNYLILETMAQMLQSFMQKEKSSLATKKDWSVIATEGDLQAEIELDQGLLVKLKGQADRIDREGSVIKILDYKSGGKDKGAYTISGKGGDFEMEDFIKKPYALQLPLYAFMYASETNPGHEVEAAILSLRKPSLNPIAMNLAGFRSLNQENRSSIGQVLKEILGELFDPNRPFQKRS